MSDNLGNSPALMAAIRQVLSGDVNKYELIYNRTDARLRLHIARRYGHSVDDDFVGEVAIRTHEYISTHLQHFNTDRGAAFQRWANIQSQNVAKQVIIERRGLHRLGPRGRRKYVDLGENFDEEMHPNRACPRPGPAEEHAAKERSRRLWQAYEALAGEGRLSVALHDLEGLRLDETAAALDKPLITVRRQLERCHDWLRERLEREGVRPVASEPVSGRVGLEADDTGYDDDWTASAPAFLPDESEASDAAAANDEVEMPED